MTKVNWLLIGKVCYGIIIGIICLIALLVILTVIPLPKDYNLFVVRSGSMSPAIQAGDLIFTQKTSSYQIGDLITFLPVSATNRLESITHRIASEKEEQGIKLYTTKGDANEEDDGNEVADSQILGKYVFRVPLVGYPVGFAKTLPGLVILIIIPVVIIIYDEIHKLRREIAKKRNQKRKGKNEKRDSS